MLIGQYVKIRHIANKHIIISSFANKHDNEVYKYKCYRGLLGNSVLCPALKEFWKSVKISRGHRPRVWYFNPFQSLIFVLPLTGRVSYTTHTRHFRWQELFCRWISCVEQFAWRPTTRQFIAFKRQLKTILFSGYLPRHIVTLC